MRTANPFPTSANKRTWWLARWLLLLILVATLMAAGAAIALGYREIAAAQELKRLPDTWSTGGMPPWGATRPGSLPAGTSQQATVQWSRILFLLSEGNVSPPEDLPVVANGKLPQLLDPREPWSANQSVGDYLEVMQPVLNEIQLAAKLPTPVWQPIAFDGYDTLLAQIQTSRSAVRLLQLEAEHALYNGQAARSMDAIDALQGTVAAHDWDIFMIAQLVHIALKTVHFQTIQRSLHTDLWNDAQLQQLMEQTARPIPVLEKFRRGLRNEQAVAYWHLQNASDRFAGMRLLTFPSAKLSLMHKFDALHQLTPQPADRLSALVFAQENQSNDKNRGVSDILFQLVMPAMSAYASALENLEQTRQLTRTAVAVKRFELMHRRWPSELSELSQLGLSSSDWTVVGIGRLGFAQDNGRAYLWGTAPQATEISLTLPAIVADGDGREPPVVALLSSHQ